MKYLVIVLLVLSFYTGCQEQPPSAVDGNARLELHAFWYPDAADSLNTEPLKNAKVILISEYGVLFKETDDNGVFIMDNLPYTKYSISVRMTHPDDPNIVIIGNLKDIDLTEIGSLCDTIFAQPMSSFGIAINEIYSAGPVNSIFFFYDQFIELYNSSDEIKYLDGMMIARVSGNNDGKGPGADEGDDGDIDGYTYVFKFPGNPGEKNYPFEPKTFKVLACDAINHSNVVGGAADLSNADWEFYNQFSADDYDNPDVSNLINIRSDRTVDFLINLVSDVIVLSDGRDTSWSDGVDINTVIDGVEYQSTTTSLQTLDDRIDRGFALSPPRYSGQSMQRREPGTDSNDGTLDWEILPHFTPGYQK